MSERAARAKRAQVRRDVRQLDEWQRQALADVADAVPSGLHPLEARRRLRLVIQRMVRAGDLDEDLAAILERTLPRSL
jgi:hypothetical protein